MKHFYFQRLSTIFIAFFVGAVMRAQTPGQDGQWSDPIGFGIVPVAVANLPDGRLITWSSQFRDTFLGEGDGATFTEIFDPFLGADGQALGEFTSNTDHDMFCPGINNLPDGRILSAGGTSSTKTSIYDPTTGLWSVASEMNIPRGYQGNVTLADGSVFTIGGSWSDGDSALTNGGKDAELWSPATGWTLLPGITGGDIYTTNDLILDNYSLYRVDNHVWLWAAPNGNIFHAGPSEMMNWIDVENGGSITEAGLRADDTFSMKGTTVMFDIGKILKVGGAETYGNGDPAKENSFVIDINNANSVTVTPTNNNLEFSRTMHNSTVLPNGEVLVTGGIDHAELFTDSGARLTAELYNPDTNSWTSVAGMVTPRTYHSVSILMVDGRVFVGGGGLCDGSNSECVNHFDAEIYSPPYLFNPDGSVATRPSISAPDTTDYNTTIPVTGSANIQEFSLIRFSAATHSTNNEQRRIPVTFSNTGGTYNVDIPDRNLLPPGYYMLFALDINGVPSVAETIQIGNALPLQNNPNLILSLEFDENSGDAVADSSGNGNNATIVEFDNNRTQIPLTQNFWNSEGLFGSAMEMDGLGGANSNSIVEVPYSSSVATIQDEITVMAWVYRDENQVNAGVFTHNYPALFFGFHNSLYKWEFPTSSGQWIECYAGYVPTNQWVHMAATFDGQVARLFANGVEICTQFATGNIVLETSHPEFSSFTISGGYDTSLTNNSGVGDELDGKIDNFKLFNKVLGEEEILFYFNQAKQNSPAVLDCVEGNIIPEYRIGLNGEWQQGNDIFVNQGNEVYIRAIVNGGQEYFVTTPVNDGPTFSSQVDLPNHSSPGSYQIDTLIPGGDGIFNSNNVGQYVFTTADGCGVVMNIDMNPSGICENGVNIFPEYRLDGVWGNGLNDLNVTEGTEVMLSIVPNDIGMDITLPNGTVVYDNYDLGAVTAANNGRYLLTTYAGCQTAINLTVGSSPCNATSVVPQYTVDGVVQSGSGTVVIDEGALVSLSATPVDAGLVITLPDGSTVGDNHSLGNVVQAQSGQYTFTSSLGCVANLTLDIVDPGACNATSIIPQYTVDGVVQNGAGAVTIDEGAVVSLSATPVDAGLVITLPDGSTVGDNHGLGAVVAGQSGQYTFTSSAGCQATLDITVQVPGSCPGISTEYRLDGVWDGGLSDLNVAEGTEVLLSILPNGVGVDIILPDGTRVWDNYDLGAVTAANNGTYLLETYDGCQTPITINVGPPGCSPTSVVPQYTVDGVVQSGSGTVVIDEGALVSLSATPVDAGLVITLPDGSTVGDNHSLGNVVQAQSGQYTFTSSLGCVANLTLDIVDPGACNATSIIPQYTVDGVVQNGAGAVTIDEGAVVSLSATPVDAGLVITLPDGSTVGDNHGLGAVVAGQSGQYTFTSSAGCQATLDITVQVPGSCPGISTEYRLDGVWDGGLSDLNVAEGTEVLLSILPNGVGVDIILPDGTRVWDNYDLGAVTAANNGTYLLETYDGCQTPITINVGPPGCSPTSVVPQYTVDGVVQSGSGTVVIDEGALVSLSATPVDAGLVITLPDGSTVGDNHSLGNVVQAQSGQYTFTSSLGCVANLTLDIVDPGACNATSIIPQYTVDGVVQNGAGAVTIDEGAVVSLSATPVDAGLVITLPDGSTVGDNHGLGAVVAGQSGQYTFTSSAGCQATLDITVQVPGSCPGISTEYRLDGVWDGGLSDLNVAEGTEVLLSILPNGVGVDIILPDGTRVWDNYDLGAVTAANNGTYLLETYDGCQTPLNLNVIPSVNALEASLGDDLQLENLEMLVYPNPVINDILYVSFNEPLSGQSEVIIYDAYGKLVSRQMVESNFNGEIQLNLSILSKGMYIIEVRNSMRVYSNKILKQ